MRQMRQYLHPKREKQRSYHSVVHLILHRSQLRNISNMDGPLPSEPVGARAD